MAFFKRNPDGEHAFKLAFKGGKAGIDRLVELATSHQKKRIVLASTNLPEPVATLLVYMEQGTGKVYMMTAELAPFARHRLKVDGSDFGRFKVEKIREGYSLKSHLLLPPNSIDVFTNNFGEGRVKLHGAIAYGTGRQLVGKEVSNSLLAFANALEDTVNAAYRHAGRQPPQKMVALAPLYLS